MSGFGEKFTHNAIVLVTAQVYLPDGSLMIEGYGTIPPNKPARMTLPVVGGTGVYMNARGSLAVRSYRKRGENETRLPPRALGTYQKAFRRYESGDRGRATRP